MPLVACKCPGCGGDLDFDDSRDMMFCSYCGTKVMKEDITNITNNITIADGFQIHDADWYFNTIIELFKQNRGAEAGTFLDDFRKNFPLDSRLSDLCRLYRVLRLLTFRRKQTEHSIQYEFRYSIDRISTSIRLGYALHNFDLAKQEYLHCINSFSEMRKLIESTDFLFDDKDMMALAENRRETLLSSIRRAEEEVKEVFDAGEKERIMEEKAQAQLAEENRQISLKYAKVFGSLFAIDLLLVKTVTWDLMIHTGDVGTGLFSLLTVIAVPVLFFLFICFVIGIFLRDSKK